MAPPELPRPSSEARKGATRALSCFRHSHKNLEATSVFTASLDFAAPFVKAARLQAPNDVYAPAPAGPVCQCDGRLRRATNDRYALVLQARRGSRAALCGTLGPEHQAIAGSANVTRLRTYAASTTWIGRRSQISVREKFERRFALGGSGGSDRHIELLGAAENISLTSLYKSDVEIVEGSFRVISVNEYSRRSPAVQLRAEPPIQTASPLRKRDFHAMIA